MTSLAFSLQQHHCMRRIVILMTILLIALALTTGCEDEKNTTPTTAYKKDVKRGPLAMNILLDKTDVTVADTLNLTLTVDAPESWDITFPEWGTTLDTFTVLETKTEPPLLTQGATLRHVCRVSLAPPLPPQATLPPLAIQAKEKNKPGSDTAQTLESESIPVTIHSLWSTDEEMSLREISGPVSLPWAPTWKEYTILGILLLLGIIITVCLHRYLHQPKTTYTAPPHVVAMDALQVLLGKQLVQKGETKQYYHELSGILRHYIENRFQLRAPERTTEEFLEDLRTTNLLEIHHKDLLEAFLTQCDLVKFARHMPTLADADAAFAACRRFVTETIPAESDLENETRRETAPDTTGGEHAL